MARQVAELTSEEYEIIQASKRDPNLFTDYFFSPKGATHGWRFDENFREEGKWQKDFALALQKDITVIGGFATGKTMGVGMTACYWGTLIADFKFLNAAEKVWQAKQMWDIIMTNARNTRFEELIYEFPRRPWYKIVIKYRYMGITHESSLEFMSVDKNAQGILSWEGDWLNIDEAGTLNNLEEIMINVGSRLRGAVRGRTRVGRFSMTSNSWDNYDLWFWFDQAVGDPEHFLSMTLSSKDNMNVTNDQLERMAARIPAEERERFLEGTRPEGRGRFFSKESVFQCEDKTIGGIVRHMAETEEPGFVFDRVHGCGVVAYEIPHHPESFYMLLGDPGTGAAPRRNAPCLMAWDVSLVPGSAATLVGFWWGNGNGKISPFIDKLIYLSNKYKPFFIGVDTTGPQKNSAVLINEYLTLRKDGEAILNRPISGIDFSGTNKAHYLLAGRLFLESRLFSWPLEITGIRSQLTNYEPENDKKLPQDIVATMVMSAFAIRMKFHVDPKNLSIFNQEALDYASKVRRLSNAARSRRTSRPQDLAAILERQ